MKSKTPSFIIKENLQKSSTTGVYFHLDRQILSDVCQKITGCKDFSLHYVDNNYCDQFLSKSYNKGRMALLLFNGTANYISFSERDINGRNSSVQSVPTAFNMFFSNQCAKKQLYYYFLNTSDAVCTDYQILIYRLMKTIGFTFLNMPTRIANSVNAFSSIDDIILNRRTNAGKNRSNNSTFITKNSSCEVEVYGKTYGANKYETSLICYALSILCRESEKIKLFEVIEGDLKTLPQSSQTVLQAMGNIQVLPADISLEKKIFDQSNSLRSPRYLFNLFNKLGNKHCALCNCNIPEIIQGAHIWPVASIKNVPSMTYDDKLLHATNGNNGLWLCENHHRMFDENLFTFSEDGNIVFNSALPPSYSSFMSEITTVTKLDATILTGEFLDYLKKRNSFTAIP